jgi:hypothetical protein
MKISICAPSYKRANIVLTKKYLPGIVRYYVDSKEYNDYKENNPNEIIIKCEDGIQGNISRIRNYILDKEFALGNDAVLIVDDDLKGVYNWENSSKKLIEKNEFMAFLEKHTILCKEFGFVLWGLNVNEDKQTYKEFTPFNTTNFIGCPFHCTLKESSLRYDERMPLKEDYDMTIQQCNKYRGCLRLNNYFYNAKQSKQVGGAASVRNFEEEKRQLKLLIKKWGSKIVKIDKRDRSTKDSRKIDYNPKIYLPIKGI